MRKFYDEDGLFYLSLTHDDLNSEGMYYSQNSEIPNIGHHFNHVSIKDVHEAVLVTFTNLDGIIRVIKTRYADYHIYVNKLIKLEAKADNLKILKDKI